jgi:alkanesulfonate monooxygenase SsuD/methylene tetrahydromethanopterin reductase-like flavin-dependent oxidoreductase (luciferase family)
MRDAIPHVRQAAVSAGRDPDALAFMLRTEIALAEVDGSERKALSRAKAIFALLAGFPGMERLYQVAGFDTQSIIAAVRAAMRIDDVLVRGGGFPELRRSGDLAAARAAIPDDYIRQLALIGGAAELAPRLVALQDLGVTCVSVAPPAEATSVRAWEHTLGTLRTCAA